MVFQTLVMAYLFDIYNKNNLGSQNGCKMQVTGFIVSSN